MSADAYIQEYCMIQLNNEHSTTLHCDMYQNAEQNQNGSRRKKDFERGFIIRADKLTVSIETVTKMTSGFRSTGEKSVHRVGHCA